MIGIIVPDRGDRPKMLANCLRMMGDYFLYVMDEKPKSELPDITYRYRIGYETLSIMDFELIVFIENDDWYHPEYVDFIYTSWVENGRPDLIGIDYTYYYHLGLRKYFKYGHAGRASMMNTAIKPGLIFKWPVDTYRFVDMYLWQKLKGVTVSPEKIYSIGMKGHGEGMTGGTGHCDKIFRYINDDNGFLESTLDKESFEFYDKFITSK